MSISGSAALPKRSCRSAACSARPSTSSSRRRWRSLQNGDRFYYLQRLDGLHLFGEMENNSFAAMIMRNTDATHLPSDVFSTPGLILEVDQTRQFNDLDGRR